jgi:glycosyltransferase involved in cell wall biosynthesis
MVMRLASLGCPLYDLARLPLPLRWTIGGAARLVGRIRWLGPILYLRWALVRERPDLVVLSQGVNWDGLHHARELQRLRLPYVLISQKATEQYWPDDRARPIVKRMYQHALAAYFVSHHNLRLTEEQLGFRLPNAAVVRNPFLVSWQDALAWPASDGVLRLACVGRFHPAEKGQDLLLRVLSQPKWRERPVEVALYGSGEWEAGISEMAALLDLRSVRVAGFASDVSRIWADHHGLILPSRAEGLPLVVVEAMLAGRVVVTTDVGGSAEVCDDGVTGFIARAATVEDVDDALERAWARRSEWPEIGAAAAAAIRGLVPADPPGELEALLLQVIERGVAIPTPLSASRKVVAAID